MPDKRPLAGLVLGLEGTAWNLSAALFGEEPAALHSSPYVPSKGGIHPREAAQHHASVMKDLISRVLTDPERIRAVAFSQGPGLGPSLRTVATAARALSIALGVPLIGVNHCVAHIEIGRWATGFSDPIVLYASGANTQVLGYLNGRYRIFGETLDIGLGNALDKFARYHDLPHPGGPAIERLARSGGYIELPYTVKGMDLAFSGLVSAAQESTAPLEDVCYSLQETAFAMCVEVTERALAHAGKDEVILVGGVGANSRLQEMLRVMCEERGAKFAVPERTYLGDNGAMIAYTGRIMLDHGVTLPLEESQIRPGYRADEVEIVWRTEPGEIFAGGPHEGGVARGAEGVVEIGEDTVAKRRLSKRYRHPELDRRLITERTRAEARLISMARRAGVPTPVIRDITTDTIVMERIRGDLLKYVAAPETIRVAGETVGRLHAAGIVHGDLTTSNMIVRDGKCVLIDFGLASTSSEVESRGVDIHVFFQTLESTAQNFGDLIEAFIEGYSGVFPNADEVIEREHEIEMRGALPLKIAVVTSNANKAREVAAYFEGVLEVEHAALECPEFRHNDLGEIARGKAEFAYERLSRPLIVDDTGLFIDALGGFPGPYAAYVQDTIGNAGILKLMEGVEERSARFETAIAFAREDGIRIFRGALPGAIVAPRGAEGFGYDPIFEYAGQTLAEMPLAEKNRVSHRARALQAFRAWIEQETGVRQNR